MWSLPRSALMLKRLLGGQRDVALQTLQSLGLTQAAQLAALALQQPHRVDDPTFEAWHIEVLRAIQQRLCRYDEDLPHVDTLPALETALGFIGRMPPHTQLKLKNVLALIEAGPKVLGPTSNNKRRHARFTTLAAHEQDTYLKQWEQSPLPPMRAAFHGLKSVAMMGYWTQPAVWPSIDYHLNTDDASAEES